MEEEPHKSRKELTSLFAAKFRSEPDGRSEPDRRFMATASGADPTARSERRAYRIAVIRHLDNLVMGDYRTAWSGFTIPVSMLTRFASSTESVPASGTAPKRFAA